MAGGVDVTAVLEPPRDAAFGDLATNVAMTLAKATTRNPRDLANELVTRIQADAELGPLVTSAEIAGPGFINLTLSPRWFADAARTIVAAGNDYGRGQADPAERVLIEFVSANPTGPPHVGHARQAAYGDGVARILEYAGHAVTREFYVNDWGRQMQLFGASVAARYGQLFGLSTAIPEDGYQGDYVVGIAELMRDEVGATVPNRAARKILPNAALSPPAAKNKPHEINATGRIKWKFCGTPTAPGRSVPDTVTQWKVKFSENQVHR